jgi:PAS domain S-box-containing protein
MHNPTRPQDAQRFPATGFDAALHHAQQALTETEERLRQVLENTAAIVFVKDFDGRYTYVNRRFCELVEREPHTLRGLRDADVFPAEVVARLRDDDRRVVETRAALEVEEQLVIRGAPCTYLAIKFPLLTARGEPYAICGIATDITERKRTEDALRSAALAVSTAEGQTLFQELTRYLATTLGVEGAFIARCSTPDHDHVATLSVYADGSFEPNIDYALAGTACGTVVGQEFRYIGSGVQQHYPADPMFRRLRIEGYAAFPLHDAAGEPLGLIAVLSRRPLGDPGLIESMLKIFAARAAAEIERRRAEAERQKLEAQLRQAQKMEAIGHVTGGIAHDFNNILTSIMGYIVLATERQAEVGDTRLGKYLDQAHLAATRARDLIRQMLTFSRGQRGDRKPQPLPPMVREAVKLLRSTLPATVEIETDLDVTVPAVILDPVQLEQVLLNLAINAHDAMGGHGRLRVSVRNTQSQGHECASCRKPIQAGRLVELSVSDTGNGIAPEVAERMFEPFFSTKEPGKGSGMGLSVVHGIVHEYGGHIVVSSAAAQGTQFRLLFEPAGGAQDALDRPVRDRAPRRRPRRQLSGRVLLVDDEQSVGEFMSELLGNWGLDVTVLGNPVAAKELLERDPGAFDLVVTDHTMPRMTGLELACHVCALRADLPVVVYSGYTELIDEDRMRACGVHAVVRKPVDPDAFLALIGKQLAGGGGASDGV